MRLTDERGDTQSLQITVLLIFLIAALFGGVYAIFGAERIRSFGTGMPAWKAVLCTVGGIVAFFGSIFAWVGLQRVREDREYRRRQQQDK